MKIGTLPDRHIEHLIEQGSIVADLNNINPASLDITIGDVYEIDGAFSVPEGYKVSDMLPIVGAKLVDRELFYGKCYIAKINEQIKLPHDVYVYANPKSTTGRLDMHTKLLADSVPMSDYLPRGFDGEIWVYIKPQSFNMYLRRGTPLNQIRFFYSDTRLNGLELADQMKRGLIYCKSNHDGFKALQYEDLQIQDSADSIVLTLDLEGPVVGYRAKKTKGLVDYHKTYNFSDFFEEVRVGKNGILKLKKGEFYILSTREVVEVPDYLACEMQAIDERFGEFRVHYAGFIDPGFPGTITLEIRTYEDLFVTHGQPCGRIKFEKMAELPSKDYKDLAGSNYIGQRGAKLAKQFVKP